MDPLVSSHLGSDWEGKRILVEHGLISVTGRLERVPGNGAQVAATLPAEYVENPPQELEVWESVAEEGVMVLRLTRERLGHVQEASNADYSFRLRVE